MLTAAWALAQKDLKSFVRDRAAMMLSILVPIALVSVFGWIMAYAFGGSGGMPKVTLHVADLGQTSASQQFVEKLESAEMLRVRRVDTAELAEGEESIEVQLEQLIRDGDAHHVLILPTEFAEDLANETLPKLQILRDPGRSMEDRVVQLSIMQAAMTELGGVVWVDAMDRVLTQQGMNEAQLKSIRTWMTSIGDTIGSFVESQVANDANSDATEGSVEGDAQSQSNAADTAEAQNEEAQDESSGLGVDDVFGFMEEIVPVEKKDIAPPDRAIRVTFQQAQSVAGMTVMMLLFALTSCGSVLLTEREEGTLRRLFAQPIPKSAVLLGKFMFVMIVGIAQMAILFAYGEWMFQVGLFRDPVTLIVLSLTWVATGGAFGMFLASVSRSSKQAESLASLLILVMAALGGCWFPLQLMDLPPLLDTVCKSTMTFWAMTGFQGMLWNQLAFYETKLLTAIGLQWAWVAVFTTLSIFFYNRNYCRG